MAREVLRSIRRARPNDRIPFRGAHFSLTKRRRTSEGALFFSLTRASWISLAGKNEEKTLSTRRCTFWCDWSRAECHTHTPSYFEQTTQHHNVWSHTIKLKMALFISQGISMPHFFVKWFTFNCCISRGMSCGCINQFVKHKITECVLQMKWRDALRICLTPAMTRREIISRRHIRCHFYRWSEILRCGFISRKLPKFWCDCCAGIHVTSRYWSVRGAVLHQSMQYYFFINERACFPSCGFAFVGPETYSLVWWTFARLHVVVVFHMNFKAW